MTSFTPAPSQSQVFIALKTFLGGILPSNLPVIRGQVNRVPEPQSADFVIFWSIRQTRIETNTDSYADSFFTGTIAGTVLTVTSVELGSVTVGNAIYAPNLLFGPTVITGQTSGTPGGVGTYTVSYNQFVANSPMQAGGEYILHPAEWAIQMDVHGPNSGDNAQTIIAFWRSEYGVNLFQSSGFDVAPLYADEARQIPFINDQQQFEDRWVIEGTLQVNEIVSFSQQFYAVAAINLIEVQ